MALSGVSLVASPPHIKPSTVPQDFWVEDFTLTDGTSSDAGTTAWTSSATYSKAIFGVYNNEFEVSNLSAGDSGVWISAPISIAGKTNVQLSAMVHSLGSLESDATVHGDFIRFYYKTDNGAEVLFSDLHGVIDNNSATGAAINTSDVISGSTLQIIVRARASAIDEFYYFDNVTVSGVAGCTAADIPSDVSAFASDRLTCNVTAVNLNGSSSTEGALYSWAGANGFSATGAHTRVTAPGAYTFTATNPVNGCSKSVPVVVSQNTTPPANVVATNAGPLTCTVTEVALTGSTASAHVEFQWDGPDGYLSFSARDVASEAGDYILTVTNTDNGCTLKNTTTVLFDCSSARKAVTVPSSDTTPNKHHF